MRILKKIAVHLRNQYQLDLRALALMRIGIGLVVMADLIIRAQSIVAHYTDEGILPLHLLKEFYDKQFYYSLHNLSGSLTWQSSLFIVHALITIAFIFGYRAKLFSILSWLMLVSLQNRDPFIQQGGDDLLRLVLFFGMFMPLGKFYSIDAKRNGTPHKMLFFSPAAIGYLLLIASVYFFSALHKTSPEWRSEGTALYYVLSLDQLRVGMGDWLYHQPALMKLLTHFVFLTELLAPLLLIFPFRNKLFRSIAIALILMLHVGIALNVYVGLFFVIGISSILGALPSRCMDWVDEKILKIKRSASLTLFKTTAKISTLRRLQNSFLIFVILFSLLMNLGNLGWFPVKINSKMMLVSDALKLDQFWGMFSPHIYKDDGWYVYRGIRPDNADWDMYNNKFNIDTIKPASIVKMYESDRWRKFAENYRKREYNFMKPFYCRYLLKKWNKEHPKNHLAGLYILFMKEESLPGYKTKPLKTENMCLCYENEYTK